MIPGYRLCTYSEMDIMPVFGTVVGGSNPSRCTMLLIDKPIGISSFGVVAAVRRATGVKKVGHAGTLDPLASGLMLVLVGKDETRQAERLLGLDKSYETVVRIGEKRDTGDLEGEIISRDTNIDILSRETLKKALKTMVGRLSLPVPAYSAIKRGGQRLYTKARKGQEFELPVRDMEVYNAEFKGIQEVLLWSDDGSECWRGYEVGVVFTVASGVYIRSLAEELGKRLGYSATTARLRRITIDKYNIEDAQTLGDMQKGDELIHHKIDV